MSEEKALKKDTKKKRLPGWLKRSLKIAAWSVGSLLALLVVAITLTVWILTPERLTPLVNEFGSSYLDADVKANRVELTFWSTFPRFRVDVDTLAVTSRSLKKLPESQRKALPEWADSLFAVNHFDGTINVLRLLIGDIALYDVNIDRPRINLLQATRDVANFDVLPPSEKEEKEPGPLPDISLGTFQILGDAPIRYVSIPDSTDISVKIAQTKLEGEENPTYRLRVDGISNARVSAITINDLKLGLGGRITFDTRHPDRLALHNLELGVGKLIARLSSELNFASDLKIETFSIDIPKVKVMDVMALIPKAMLEGVPAFETDMTFTADARLTRPFLPATKGADTIPSLTASVKIDADRFVLDRLTLKKLALNMTAALDGHDLDRSSFDVRKISAMGLGVDFEASLKGSRLVSDPAFEGTFRGELDLSKLPRQLTATLPMRLSGRLTANAGFAGRLSYLTKERFHNLSMTGEANLHDFRMVMNDGSGSAFVRHGEFKLGTSSSFVKDSHRADSLLTLSARIDTVAYVTPEMKLTGVKLLAGVGCQNNSQTADTSSITPLGATLKVGRLRFLSPVDTLYTSLRDVSAGIVLSRFKGNSRQPRLDVRLNAGKIRYADKFNRASLSDGAAKLTLHPREFEMPPRMKHFVDSVSRRHPGLAPDSVRRLAFKELRAQRRRPTAETDSLDLRENIDFGLDGSVKGLLIRWQAEGSLTAKTGRVMTPYFPLRCKVENLDLSFTTNQVDLKNTTFYVGNSDFRVNGSISNILRAVMSRTGRQPIKVRLALESRLVDVNQLAEAAFAGSAFAEKAGTTEVSIVDSADDDDVQKSVAENTGEVGALIVPSNVDAELIVHANRISYSDVLLSGLEGAVRVKDGALNLDELSANSDAGSVRLTALYNAPTRRDLNFAFSLDLEDFHIKKFLQMLPSIDSIMPLLRDIDGIINADIAATTKLDQGMNIDFPTLSAAVRLSGDSLVLMDNETFRTIGKWLLFKNKNRNLVDHMSTELIVQDNELEIYPFMFDIDRYRLGILGGNDLAMNFKYHVSVLKSPIPFKFGINLSGNANKMKVRLGGAKYKDNMAVERVRIAETTRVNLVRSIKNAFARGVRNGQVGRLHFEQSGDWHRDDEASDTISHADSLLFIERGLIPAPPAPPAPAPAKTTE